MAKHEGRRSQRQRDPAMRDPARAGFVARLRDNLNSRVFADDALRSGSGNDPATPVDSMVMAIKAIERLIENVAGIGANDRPARLRRLASYFSSRSRALVHHADALSGDAES